MSRDTPRRRMRWSPDRTRARTATVNQLLLGAVVLAMTVLIVPGDFQGRVDVFFLGVTVVFLASAATLIVPWNRISPGWMAIIPALDVWAIWLMRDSSDFAGFGLLWIFPAIWLPASFGLAGLVAAVLGVGFVVALSLAVTPSPVTYAGLLLPLVVVAVSGTSYLTARRASAQRSLLDKQAELLGRALERARRQEQEVTEVLDAVDFGVIRIAPGGSVAVTNEAHARLQQAIRAEAADPTAPEAYSEDGVTPVPPGDLPLDRAMRGEALDGQIVWFGPPRGDRRALTYTVRRLVGNDGRDAGAVLVSRDVTSELTAMRARDDLVASVSHELRTPLTSILGYIDLAIDDDDMPESARHQLEIAERNAERLLGIVADILAASSSSRSSVELTVLPREIDVAEVVRASVESMQPRAAERVVSIDESGIEPSPAFADPLRVRQVIDNLLSNAIKYNRDGGTISVGCTTDRDSTWILVRDTGIGMTEEELAGLFERFYRAKSIRGSGMRGSGLGLAISRDIARAHGGDITVRSSPGVGSTFVVRLPSTRAASAPALRLSAPTVRQSEEALDEALDDVRAVVEPVAPDRDDRVDEGTSA